MADRPAFDGYFADPFLLATDEGWIAYGSGAPFTAGGSGFRALQSEDLVEWNDRGPVLEVDPRFGTDVWAPEVLHADGAWWMYYSAGFGIDRHHLRVARADHPLGPFQDCAVDLTPHERFAIDAHPFTDVDGRRYLFFAHDVLDHARPGTHLAVAPMRSLTEIDPHPTPVLQPNADWQLYATDRSMYGRRFDWHTLEGPTVLRHDDGYVLFYSAGSWEGDRYGVSYATAPSPLGPWRHASEDRPLVLSSGITGQLGPGHNSVLQLSDHRTVTAYHAWNIDRSRRQMHVRALTWRGSTPTIGLEPLGPTPVHPPRIRGSRA